MGNKIDFDREFGTPRKLMDKDFNKLEIDIHPDFYGIYLCFDELLKSHIITLNFLIEQQQQPLQLSVWKDQTYNRYRVVTDLLKFIYLNDNPQRISLNIYNYPTDIAQIEHLKQLESKTFLNFLTSYHTDLQKLNPKRMLAMINAYIAAKEILDLNKKNSFKPHRKMSLELFAKLLSLDRNQLNYRIRSAELPRKNLINQLEKNSPIIKKMLNNTAFELQINDIWS